MIVDLFKRDTEKEIEGHRYSPNQNNQFFQIQVVVAIFINEIYNNQYYLK